MTTRNSNWINRRDRPGWLPILSVPLLVAIFFWSALAERPWDWLMPGRVEVVLNDHTFQVPPYRLSRLSEREPDWLSQAEADALRVLENEIEQASDQLFDAVSDRIPDFADWYYSMSGLTARGVTGLLDWMLADPTDYVATALSQQLFPAEQWETEMQVLEQAINRAYQERMTVLQHEWLRWLEQELSSYRVTASSDATEAEAVDVTARVQARIRDAMDTERAAVQMASGGISGVGAVLAVRSVSAASARAAAARAGTRLATRSTAAGASGACAGAGPLAIACGVVVFSGATLGTEWALLRADEAMNRNDLEVALEHSIRELQLEMMATYSPRLLYSLEADMALLNQAISGSLRPIDHLSR